MISWYDVFVFPFLQYYVKYKCGKKYTRLVCLVWETFSLFVSQLRYNFRQNLMDQQNEQMNIYEQDIEILKEQVRNITSLLLLLSVCIIKIVNQGICFFGHSSYVILDRIWSYSGSVICIY